MSGNVFSKHYNIGSKTGAVFSTLTSIFYGCKNFLDNHPGFQRIASYSGSLPSSGFNPVAWEDFPMGERAFCVWRAVSASNNVDSTLIPNAVPTFDIAISVAYNETTTTNPRSWKSTLDYGLTFSMAWHSSSRSWAGTSNNNGTDTFTAGASAPFSASSIVFPRVNGTSGTDATNRNGMLTFDNGTIAATDSTLFCTGDNDTLAFILRPANAVASKVIILGGYQRVSSSHNVPLFLWDGTVRGTDIGSTTNRTGGGIAASSSNGVRLGRIDYPGYFNDPADTSFKNSLNFSDIMEFPISIFQYETSHYRPAGSLHSISASNYAPSRPLFFTNGSNTRLLVKINAGVSNIHLTFPWSGSIDGQVI